MERNCCLCQALDSGRHGDFLAQKKTSFHRTTCDICSAMALWERTGRELILSVRKYLQCNGDPSAVAWTSKLAPESFALMANKDVKNIMWCDDHKCRVMRRYEGLYYRLRMLPKSKLEFGHKSVPKNYRSQVHDTQDSRKGWFSAKLIRHASKSVQAG